jgi:predicted signal transduction protein with EAL and GGDEF domain
MLVSTCLCIIFLSLNAITHDMPQNPALSAGLIHMINNMNIVISFTAVGLISYYFRHASMTLEQQLETLANTDSLTGLYNRRRMQKMLEQQKSMPLRNSSDFTLIFVDIHHFKNFNDTYGHSCGDYVLSEVAFFMRNHLRQGDVLSRWGGEEFLIMLPIRISTERDHRRENTQGDCRTELS